MTRRDDLMLPAASILPDEAYTMGLEPIAYYTADQMREYARKAVEAEREACAALCESLDDASYPTRRVWPSECAEAIRARTSD